MNIIMTRGNMKELLQVLYKRYKAKRKKLDEMLIDVDISKNTYYKILNIDNYEETMKDATWRRTMGNIKQLFKENKD